MTLGVNKEGKAVALGQYVCQMDKQPIALASFISTLKLASVKKMLPLRLAVGKPVKHFLN